MFTATVRGMLAHKLRLVLTTASIALGVAFLAGTLILTDTMQLAFDQLFGKVSSGTDAVVRQEAPSTGVDGAEAGHPPIPESVLETVRGVDGVRAAEGTVSGYALLTDAEGKAILSEGGASTMGYSLPADEGLRGDVTILSGRAPARPGEVVIDATSAEKAGVDVGSPITVLFRGPAEEFTVVGTVGFGGEKDLGGTTSAYFEADTAQRVLGTPGAFDTISVAADAGVSEEAVTERLDAALPGDVEAITGEAMAQEASDAIKASLGFVTIMFMVFAAIALFVGSFIIWNTFAMIVTQRSREIALLRAVGATRRQVLRSLLTEALLLGLGSSVIGVGLGTGVAYGLTALMDVMGFSLPSTSMQVEPRTVWVSLLVGTLVTVVAAISPARRATKVLPVEALRDAVPGFGRPSRSRAVAGVLLTAVGVGCLLAGLYADGGMALVGGGVLGSVLGITTLAPLAARPFSGVIGWPLRLRGVPGDLARQNAMRNPRRTASTAAALMIGLTMVVSMSVFADSLKASFGDVLAGSTEADLFVTKSSPQAEGFSPEASAAAAEVEGVATVSSLGWGEMRVDGAGTSYSSVDPSTAEQVLNLDVSAGEVADLAGGGVMVARQAADEHGWEIGDTVSAEFPVTGVQELEVVAVYDSRGFVASDFVLSNDAQLEYAGSRLDSNALVLVEEGADVAAVQARVADALVGHPDAVVLDQDGYEEVAGGFVDKLLAFVTILLLLAVVIALLGIVNTLALSVHERTRELGLLRAVGMTQSQVRAMVRWESVVISVLGASFGSVLGIGLGAALAKAMADQGITAVSVPGPQVALYVGAAAVAGLLAAVGPARRAARVDVLRAVVTD